LPDIILRQTLLAHTSPSPVAQKLKTHNINRSSLEGSRKNSQGQARPGQPPIIDCENSKQLLRDYDRNFECLVLLIGCGFCVAVFVARSAFSRAVKNRFERSNPTTGTHPSLGKTPFQGLHTPYIGDLPIVVPPWRFEFRRGLWCPAHVPEVKDCRFFRFSA